MSIDSAAMWLHAHLTENLKRVRVDPPMLVSSLTRDGMAWLLCMLAHLNGVHSTIRASEGATLDAIEREFIRLCDLRDRCE